LNDATVGTVTIKFKNEVKMDKSTETSYDGSSGQKISTLHGMLYKLQSRDFLTELCFNTYQHSLLQYFLLIPTSF